MAEIMAESRHAKHSTPIASGIVILDFPQQVPDFVNNFLSSGDNIKHSGCHFHDAERVFEAPMCGSRIQQIGHSELVDVTKALKRLGIQYLAFIRIQAYENMNRIAHLMDKLRHDSSYTAETARRPKSVPSHG
jgi:hypothetical protein